MSQASYTILEHRAVLTLAGADVRSFLQGIVSNDVARVSTEAALWTAFLTPQGKFLHEFFMVERPGAEDGRTLLWLDCEAERRADLLRRLKLYKLRADVVLEDAAEDLTVAALFGPGSAEALGLAGAAPGTAADFAGGVAFLDPRLAGLGARALLPRDGAEAALSVAGFQAAGLEAYDALRIGLGVPDGSRDLEVEKSLLLESGCEFCGACIDVCPTGALVERDYKWEKAKTQSSTRVVTVAVKRPNERRKTRQLMAQGAEEFGARHYPLLVLLHAAWLLALLLTVPGDAAINWWLIALFGLLQIGRLWVIASLGRYWTTRVISLDGLPLVGRGPYRFTRHPNYAIVVAEIAVLPLAFGAWELALIFSVPNLAILAWRIRIENDAIAPRRASPTA